MSTASESPAFSTFRRNISRMVHLFELLDESVDRTSSELSSFKSLPSTEDPEEVKQRTEKGENLNARISKINAQMDLSTEWGCVMLVTCAETYLQDALSYFAGLDSTLMNDSDQKASYREVISAASVDELAEELRGRWARNVIDDGGPRKWVDRFRRMGAATLENFDGGPMEELWGSRHLIVHRAGKVTRDFLSRHPNCAAAVGDQLVIPWQKLSEYVKSTRAFVVTVEQFLNNRQAGRSRQNAS
ncbi:MAG TPA: hypothetical protein VGP73_01970 [Thermoanaerobaculia bacterium]